MVRIWQRQENTVSTNALDNFRDQGVAVLQATVIAFVFGSVDDSGILTVKRTNIDLEGVTVGAARIDLLRWLRIWLIDCASAGPTHRKLTAETVLLECWHDERARCESRVVSTQIGLAWSTESLSVGHNTCGDFGNDFVNQRNAFWRLKLSIYCFTLEGPTPLPNILPGCPPVISHHSLPDTQARLRPQHPLIVVSHMGHKDPCRTLLEKFHGTLVRPQLRV